MTRGGGGRTDRRGAKANERGACFLPPLSSPSSFVRFSSIAAAVAVEGRKAPPRVQGGGKEEEGGAWAIGPGRSLGRSVDRRADSPQHFPGKEVLVVPAGGWRESPTPSPTPSELLSQQFSTKTGGEEFWWCAR